MKKHQRRNRPVRVNWGKLKGVVSPLLAHPRRLACFSALGLVLLGLVLTKSLPYALAPSDPEAALDLNSNNPAALIAKAEKVYTQLFIARGAQTIPQEANLRNGGSADAASETKTGNVWEVDQLRKEEVRRLAVKAIVNDPLNAEAFRLLAETSDHSDDVRRMMQETLKRSRRHPTALLWVLNDSVARSDFKAVLVHADLLLRVNPELSAEAFNFLARIAETPEGRALLVQELAKAPPWRNSFFDALPGNVKDLSIPRELLIALKETTKPPKNKELSPYLLFLIHSNLVDAAYDAWLQFLPEAERNRLGLLTHPNFEEDSTGLPFDWQIAQGSNSVAELSPVDGQTERALRVSFSGGRVQFPEVSQVVRLTPGKYRFLGNLRGSMTAKRGLRWQLRCLGGAHQILGETDMLIGQSENWRVFSFEADVPESEDCHGQVLRLFHDSRTASEQLIYGQAWFGGLRLEQIGAPTDAR